MARAKKLPSGRWRVRVYAGKGSDGKGRYESFTADTRREAEAMAASFAVAKNARPADMTVHEAIDAYINSKAEVLSPSTVKGYRALYRGSYERLTGISLRELTQRDLQVWCNVYATSHTPKATRNAYGLLRAALAMFSPSSAFSVTLPAKQHTELYTPSDDEVRALLDACTDPELRFAIMLAAFGPLRRGEICALDHADIEGTTVHVRRSVVRGDDGVWHVKEPKTYDSYRDVDFTPEIMAYLPDGEGPIVHCTPDRLTERFDRLRNRAGLPYFRFHDLRSYAASIMHYIAGVSDLTPMGRGGWKTDYVMKRVYRREISDERRREERLVLDHFSAVVGKI